ncbi:hypothetical protein QYE76_053921 [Lolium multiflorum]|uniref:GAG-pre-integrase domain-containing protein n=1 Tax=Lolium multiflorum TaxID=4521 RepID=A0AAD8SXP6_LOLMU|nr:hypothetical protein QYE76_053921 [Lolium multiflorum]
MRPHTGSPGLLTPRPPPQAYYAAPPPMYHAPSSPLYANPYGAEPSSLYTNPGGGLAPYQLPTMPLVSSSSTAPPLLPTPTPTWDQAAFLQAMNNFAAQGNSGDGSTIPIYCVGHTNIPSPTKPLLLRDVLLAPALIKNLISVRQFTRDNLVSVEFDYFGLSVKDYLTKAEIARFNSSGDLYTIHGTSTAAQPSSMLASVELWHQRLGHPNTATISFSHNPCPGRHLNSPSFTAMPTLPSYACLLRCAGQLRSSTL